MTTTPINRIATYTNTEDGIEARVNRLDNGGVSVTFFDLDAEELSTSIAIYPAGMLDAAREYAAILAGVDLRE